MLIAILVLPTIPASALTTTLPSTDVRFYRPFEEPVPGQVKLEINKILKGVCHQHSALDKRSDAWQCEADNQTFETCFIKNNIKPELAMCVMAPWQKDVVVIDLKEQDELPDNMNKNQDSLDMSVDDPWAIQLSDGAYCLKIPQIKESDDVTQSLVNGQRIKYTCNNGSLLFGHIQRCELIWKILWLPSRTSNELKMTQIGTAWY